MPELQFKGKEFVYNHHLTVPIRPLIPDAAKSVGQPSLDGNLIIHGDNLHALQALLPMYAGKVDCIFIDPPYNTGNENWCYNDNVNSPIMREWLNNNPVNAEDMLRHDKWACMMWPRLMLLKELLSEEGAIFVTIDDNEAAPLKILMDEILGNDNFVTSIAWQKKVSPANDAKWFSYDHDFILVYAKNKEVWRPFRLERNENQLAYYSNTDNDPRGQWNSVTYTCNKTREERPNLYYPIMNPNTREEIYPKETAVWKYGKDVCDKHIADNLLYWGQDGTAKYPRLKKFLFDADNIVPRSIWSYTDVGHTQQATQEIQRLFPDNPSIFTTPKPLSLISRILELATDEESLILDSFAGSGTTAHAVLAANKKDGGSRRFILVECEDYADTITAERVRRVIHGYEYQGKQKEELLRETITFTKFRQANRLLNDIQGLETIYGPSWDRIDKKIKDGVLTVTAERTVTERTEGLGGAFTYCTLGEPLDLDRLLTGETLPSYETIGAWLFHTATREPFDPSAMNEADGYLGQSAAYHVWLIYRPDLDFLKSRDAALTLTKAEAIAQSRTDKRHLVFAPAKFISQKLLNQKNLPVDFAPLPTALFRLERSQQGGA